MIKNWIQKAIEFLHIELFGLPPLKFEELENSFRVTMYSPKAFAELTPMERVEACYQHSIIKYYSTGGMTNASLRERFKIHDKQRPQVSLVLKGLWRKARSSPGTPIMFRPSLQNISRHGG